GVAAEDPAFDDWLRGERERLRELAIAALASRLAEHEAAGAAEPALRCAARLLVLDPLQEAAHRAVMRLHAAAGRRAAALRQYQICADALRRELGADPDPETRALHQALLRQGGDGAARVPPPVAARPVPAPLVGRREELAGLHQAMQAAWL